MTSLPNHTFKHGNLVSESCLLRMHAMHHCSQMDRQACIWHKGDPHWSHTLWEFAGALFFSQIPSSSFGLCHSILEMGWILGLWCPFAFTVLPHLIYSYRRLWVCWVLMQHEQMIDRNKNGLASGVLIYVRRICGQFWLVLKTRNVMSGFLSWRHCGYEVFWIQIKYFIVSLPHDENFWNVVNTLRLSKGSDCTFFSDFSYDF